MPISTKLKTIYWYLEVPIGAAFSSLPLCLKTLAAFAAPDSPLLLFHSENLQGTRISPSYTIAWLSSPGSWAIIALTVLPYKCPLSWSFHIFCPGFFLCWKINLIFITPSLAGVEVSYMFICFYGQVQSQLRSSCLDKISLQISFLDIAWSFCLVNNGQKRVHRISAHVFFLFIVILFLKKKSVLGSSI